MTDELVVTYCGVVYPYQCDHMGHLNVQHYVAKFDQATWKVFAMIGVNRTYIQEKKLGVAAIRQNITYRRELLPGDTVTIRSGILEINAKQIQLYHEMRNDETGQVAATTLITAIHMDIQKRRACPFPDEILESARGLLVSIIPMV